MCNLLSLIWKNDTRPALSEPDLHEWQTARPINANRIKKTLTITFAIKYTNKYSDWLQSIKPILSVASSIHQVENFNIHAGVCHGYEISCRWEPHHDLWSKRTTHIQRYKKAADYCVCHFTDMHGWSHGCIWLRCMGPANALARITGRLALIPWSGAKNDEVHQKPDSLVWHTIPLLSG